MARPSNRTKGAAEVGSVIIPLGMKVKIESTEHPAELRSRLREEAAESRHARRKDFLITCVVMAGVAAIGAACLWVAFGPGQSQDDKKWATSILTGMVSAGVGFLTGKAVK